MNRVTGCTLLAMLLVLLAGCASSGAKHRPIVDGRPSAKYEADLTKCQELARQHAHVDGDSAMGTAASAAVGGILGGAIGAAASAVNRGVYSVQEGARERARIVSRCMRERGHKVVN